jgi:hypothetical protein
MALRATSGTAQQSPVPWRSRLLLLAYDSYHSVRQGSRVELTCSGWSPSRVHTVLILTLLATGTRCVRCHHYYLGQGNLANEYPPLSAWMFYVVQCVTLMVLHTPLASVPYQAHLLSAGIVRAVWARAKAPGPT